MDGMPGSGGGLLGEGRDWRLYLHGVAKERVLTDSEVALGWNDGSRGGGVRTGRAM